MTAGENNTIGTDADVFGAVAELMARHNLRASGISLHAAPSNLGVIRVWTEDDITAWGAALDIPVGVTRCDDRSVIYSTQRVPICGRRIEISLVVLSDIYTEASRTVGAEFAGRLDETIAAALAVAKDETAAADAATRVNVPGSDQMRVYSFGHGHTDPRTGASLLGSCAVVTAASAERCRQLMLNHFGQRWSAEYQTIDEASGVGEELLRVHVTIVDTEPNATVVYGELTCDQCDATAENCSAHISSCPVYQAKQLAGRVAS